MTDETSQKLARPDGRFAANSHLLLFSLSTPEVALLEVLVAGDPAALQVDHDDVPEEGHHVPLLGLRVEVEADPGEAGRDAVELGLDDGQQDEERQLAAPE